NNIIFLALDATKSRMIRAYLNPDTPVYATSQLFANNNDALFNHDLNGILFMDMPWLLQPNNPAVTAYREMIQTKSTDMERFTALGIDALRLAAHMLQAQSADEISLHGVTGRIYFVPPGQFAREPLFAQFEKGKVILLDVQEEKIVD
ncbi:MAG: penicillin-binding protein activator, partial [Nitrosomonas sp.]|nr:penicillin-binding protein activator [Nitrosomonas sp.]